MNIRTSTLQRETIAKIEFRPAISIIMPFTPVITAKKNLDQHLKNVMAKVESILSAQYIAEIAFPAIIKLRNTLAGLNYNSFKKSVAIFLSPITEAVFYFDIEMEEKILIDSPFKIRDLIGCKKQKKEYLILQLGPLFSKMYLGTEQGLQLIKSNMQQAALYAENTVVQEAPHSCDITDQRENPGKKFLFQMDQGLSLMLRSHHLPVILVGPGNLLAEFRMLTKNEEHLVHFIPGDFEPDGLLQSKAIPAEIVNRWERIQQLHLLQVIIKAKTLNKLKTGLQDTMKATMQGKGKLLVIGKKFLRNAADSQMNNPFFKTDFTTNTDFFIKSEIDNIIKNVFEHGGDVAYLDDGLLKNYGELTLIEEYRQEGASFESER